MTDCIADDSTDCDCPSCVEDQLEWERDQGWHDDGSDDHSGPCIGAACINPNPIHTRDECFSAAWARDYYAGERAPKRARRRVRMARKRRRGWA